MVSTRGKQSAKSAVEDQSAVAKQFGSDVNASPPEPQILTAAQVEAVQKENEATIGSRLRKRRRSASPSRDESPVTAKRQSASQAVSPDASRNKQDVSSREINKRPRTTAQDTPYEDLPANDLVAATATEHTPAVAQNVITPGSPTQDFQAVMLDIISHSETLDSLRASQGYEEMGTVDTASFLPQGADLHLKTQSLPATQILNILAKSNYQEILTIATKPESDPGKAYNKLKDLFSLAKKVYSSTEPFLSPHELGLIENAHIDTIRKANMATFVSSVFGSQDVGFYHLNEFFLDTFVADGNKILKVQAQLFLDLKTQAFISATSTGERSKDDILEDLFPADLEQRLLHRRPGAKQLAPSEQDFVLRAKNRRKALLEEPTSDDAIAALPEKYSWEEFLKDVSSYISKNFETIAGEPARKTSRGSRVSNSFVAQQRQQAAQGDQQASPIADRDDIASKAHKAAQIAMQGFNNHQGPPVPPQPPSNTPQQIKPLTPVSVQSSTSKAQASQPQPPQYQYHFENQLHPNVPSPPVPYFQHIPYQHPGMREPWHPASLGQLHPSYSDKALIPYPTQSAPTQVLYERARAAANTKTSPANRRTGHPSQRRPWTADEENSLMAGLDRVKGPHWSQILAMFGPGGTINEVLKDRNQVQLKDKARNLKLFFLKSSIEVPYYLQFVTGELKTRAPAQAAKNEAKGRRHAEEDRAHVDGVNALAGLNLPEGSEPEKQGGNNHVAPTAPMAGGTENVDPALEASTRQQRLQQQSDDAAAQLISAAAAAGNVAPSADMLTGRTQQQQQQYPAAATQFSFQHFQGSPGGQAGAM